MRRAILLLLAVAVSMPGLFQDTRLHAVQAAAFAGLLSTQVMRP